MYIIEIERNPNGDSRTAPKDISFKEFQKANDMHIKDMQGIMNELGVQLMRQGTNHDFTKKSHEKEFYDNFLETINDGKDFITNTWYPMHVEKERHHLLSNCPSDVNLFDVIEMIADCVSAGKARSGSVRDVEINDEILKLAFANTVKYIDAMTRVKE